MCKVPYLNFFFVSLATWVERETIYQYSVREVAGSHLGRGTIVGGVFHSANDTGHAIYSKFIYN